ncbi:kinetochore protein-like protein spc24 [Phyllosticta capitalensis]|uniref:kinetochore protein-like protein spc24 n=1 Tax=Phyllosticta capitalensis TaxID=121624 RepID=UPI00313133BC
MLLDEDPATLIHQCASNFNIAPDRSALSRITTSQFHLSAFRQHHLQDQQTTLQALSRKLSALQSQQNLAAAQHNPGEHASEILRLDTEKFRVAKQVNDLEIEEERLSQELERLKGELEDVEAQGVEGGERKVDLAEEDAVVLKLRAYRSLGIDVEADPTTGNYNKAVIRNAAKGDVHVVNIDPKFSRFFYAKYFWDTM